MSPLLTEDAEFSHSMDESGAVYSEPHSGTLRTTDKQDFAQRSALAYDT